MSTALGSHPRSTRRGDSLGLAATALSWAIAMALVAAALQDPAHIDHITIDNPLPWHVHIDVTDADGDGWVGVGRVHREHEQTYGSVLDQGDTWIFRFSYGGQHAEIRVSRFQLEQNDWRVTVPDQLATRLETADVPETPH